MAYSPVRNNCASVNDSVCHCMPPWQCFDDVTLVECPATYWHTYVAHTLHIYMACCDKQWPTKSSTQYYSQFLGGILWNLLYRVLSANYHIVHIHVFLSTNLWPTHSLVSFFLPVTLSSLLRLSSSSNFCWWSTIMLAAATYKHFYICSESCEFSMSLLSLTTDWMKLFEP